MVNTTKIEGIERQLERTLSFFPRLEVKIGVVGTIDISLLTLSAVNLNISDLKHWYFGIDAVVILLATMASLICLYISHYPSLKGDQNSLLYFGGIAQLDQAQYIEQVQKQSPDAHTKDLLRQIWHNSRILSKKYRYLDKGIRFATIGFMAFVVLLILTTIHAHQFPKV